MLVQLSRCQNQKNTIDPEKIIDNYGADAVRLFILSDSPPEKDIQWSDQGIITSHKSLFKNFGYYIKNYTKKGNKQKSRK